MQSSAETSPDTTPCAVIDRLRHQLRIQPNVEQILTQILEGRIQVVK